MAIAIVFGAAQSEAFAECDAGPDTDPTCFKKITCHTDPNSLSKNAVTVDVTQTATSSGVFQIQVKQTSPESVDETFTPVHTEIPGHWWVFTDETQFRSGDERVAFTLREFNMGSGDTAVTVYTDRIHRITHVPYTPLVCEVEFSH